MDEIIEVRLDNDSLEAAQAFMATTFSSFSIQDRIAIFVVKDREVISKDIQRLYDSLPVSVPFTIPVSDKVKIKPYLEANNKIYNNWLAIENFIGSMYFVEEKDIENDNSRN